MGKIHKQTAIVFLPQNRKIPAKAMNDLAFAGILLDCCFLSGTFFNSPFRQFSAKKKVRCFLRLCVLEQFFFDYVFSHWRSA